MRKITGELTDRQGDAIGVPGMRKDPFSDPDCPPSLFSLLVWPKVEGVVCRVHDSQGLAIRMGGKVVPTRSEREERTETGRKGRQEAGSVESAGIVMGRKTTMNK